MTDQSILPWQQQVWASLTERLDAGTLPHALLIHGSAGVGKLALAQALIARVLCEKARGQALACGECRGCRLDRAQSHDDRRDLLLEESRNTIGIEAVRELIEFMNLTQGARSKVALVAPADRLTVNAANSLLKTLEEPNGKAILVLVSAKPALLPATIRSRCHKVFIALPDTDTAIAWLSRELDPTVAANALHLARGAPLHAVTEAQPQWQEKRDEVFAQWQSVAKQPDVAIEVAGKWHSEHGIQALRWIHSWLGDVIRCRGASDTPLCDERRRSALQSLGKRLDLQPVFRHLATVERAMRDAQGSLNGQLQMENVVLEWGDLFR